MMIKSGLEPFQVMYVSMLSVKADVEQSGDDVHLVNFSAVCDEMGRVQNKVSQDEATGLNAWMTQSWANVEETCCI